MELLVATRNPHKRAEIAAGLSDLPINVIAEEQVCKWPIIVEDGKSFDENALKKAHLAADFSGCITLADDSGLEVDALKGAPGIFSARYAGEDSNDARNNEKLLRALVGVPATERGARFVCVLALCVPLSRGGKEWVFRGECTGTITFTPKGANGFGYDPVFYYPPLSRTFAELDRETKGHVSHRGMALRKLKEALPVLFSL